MAVAALAELLPETVEYRDQYEKTNATLSWWNWYAAYMNAREHGSTQEHASGVAGRYMDEVLHVLPG